MQISLRRLIKKNPDKCTHLHIHKVWDSIYMGLQKIFKKCVSIEQGRGTELFLSDSAGWFGLSLV